MVEQMSRQPMPEASWTMSLLDPQRDDTILQSIRAALGPTWSVEQEIDYLGEISIIAMPDDDEAAHPTLILFEKQGQAHVGVVHNDNWDSLIAFATRSAAVAALIDSGLKAQANPG